MYILDKLKFKLIKKTMKTNFKVGDIFFEEWIHTVADVRRFAQLSGDFNPIHINKKASKSLGFKNVVVHGNLACAYISRVIGMFFPGNGALLLEQNISFSKPIYPKDNINFVFKIDSINEYLDLLVIKVKATKVIDDNIKEVTVLRGKVICQISNKILQS